MIIDGFTQVSGSKVTVIGLTYMDIEKLKESEQVLAIDPKRIGNNDHVVVMASLTQAGLSKKYENFMKDIKANTKKKLDQ